MAGIGIRSCDLHIISLLLYHVPTVLIGNICTVWLNKQPHHKQEITTAVHKILMLKTKIQPQHSSPKTERRWFISNVFSTGVSFLEIKLSLT